VELESQIDDVRMQFVAALLVVDCIRKHLRDGEFSYVARFCQILTET